MQLKNILDICADNEIEKFEYTLLKGSVDTDATGIASDSRKVTDGGIFVCIVGAVSDGHKYIGQIKDKAAVIVVQKGSDYEVPSGDVTLIECDNTRLALALMSAAFYGNPDKKLVMKRFLRVIQRQSPYRSMKHSVRWLMQAARLWLWRFLHRDLSLIEQLVLCLI